MTLVNRSKRADATNLAVTVRAIDRLGRSVASDTNYISLIPAGGSFNLAGSMSPNVSLNATNLKVKVREGRSVPRSIGHRLPEVTNVTLHESLGFADIYATLTNRSSKPLSQYAPVYVLYLDDEGRVISSSFDTTGATVRPHASVRLHLQEFYDGSQHPAAARVSVDACTSVDVGC